MKFKEIWAGIKWYWSNRKKLSKAKKEVMDVKQAILLAKEDKKITKAEMRKILMETDDVLEIVIELMED